MTTLLHVGLSAFCLFDLGSALVECKDFFLIVNYEMLKSNFF